MSGILKLDNADNKDGKTKVSIKRFRRFANIRVYLAVFMLQSTLLSVQAVYLTAILTTLSKRFNWPSSLAGLLVSASIIGNASVTVFIGHFGKRWHVPRTLATCMCLAIFASLWNTLPHVIFGPGTSPIAIANEITQNVTMVTSAKQKSSVCLISEAPGLYSPINGTEGALPDDVRSGKTKLPSDAPSTTESMASYAIFFIGEIIYGMAANPTWTLGVPFVDNNVKRSNSVFFLGLWVGFRYMAPVVSYVVGSITLKIPIDLRATELTPEHPRWMGAWWLGYIICACMLAPLCLIMFMFPRTFSQQKIQEPQEEVEDKLESNKQSAMKSMISDFKDLPRAVLRLLMNMVYMLTTIAFCADAMQYGYYTFALKYLEVQFQQSAAMSSVFGGFLPNIALMCASVLSGAVFSRMKKHTVFIYSLIITILANVCILLIAGLMLIRCPEMPLAGRHGDSIDLTTACNTNCSCPVGKIDPVCGSDGLVYYSPCHAGCSGIQGNNTDFGDCSCIPDGLALRGLCSSTCGYLIPYIVLGLVWAVTRSFYVVPLILVFMRSVKEERDTSLGLSVMSFIACVFVFPAPIFYGKAIDDTCLLAISGAGSGGKGDCQIYSRSGIRYIIHGITLAFQVVAGVIYGGASIRAWRNEKKADRKRKSQHEIEDRQVQLKLMDRIDLENRVLEPRMFHSSAGDENGRLNVGGEDEILLDHTEERGLSK